MITRILLRPEHLVDSTIHIEPQEAGSIEEEIDQRRGERGIEGSRKYGDGDRVKGAHIGVLHVVDGDVDKPVDDACTENEAGFHRRAIGNESFGQFAYGKADYHETEDVMAEPGVGSNVLEDTAKCPCKHCALFVFDDGVVDDQEKNEVG